MSASEAIGQEEHAAVEGAFPLIKIQFPMRIVIFQTMKMNQLIKLSFASLKAARDIRLAQARPRTLTITLGEWEAKSVEFKFDDGFSCIVGTKRALGVRGVIGRFSSTNTLSGEILDNCTTDKCVFTTVPEESDLPDGVNKVFEFLCTLFPEAVTTNLVVRGEAAHLWPVINSIRPITSVDRLELCGDWGSEAHLKEVFDGFLENMTFKKLGFYDSPPLGSKIMNITTDEISFRLDRAWWCTEERLKKMDAKKITVHNSRFFSGNFFEALKSWHHGTGLQRLESFTCYEHNFGSTSTRVIKKQLRHRQLPISEWNKNLRPGYHCTYSIGKGGEKKVCKFQDLRYAKDLANQEGRLGTIITDEREDKLMFLVWTEKELESVREACGVIKKCRQMHLQIRKEIQKEMAGQSLEEPNAGTNDRDLEELDPLEKLRKKVELLARKRRFRFTGCRPMEPHIQNQQGEEAWGMKENEMAIEECNSFLKIIKR